MRHIDYEGDDVIAVFSSEDKANAYRDAIKAVDEDDRWEKLNFCRFDCLSVTAWEVDKECKKSI
jgi:hypothetical protein